MISIGRLNPRTKARLVSFGSLDACYRRKLLAMGLTLGSEVELVRVAPLGCPLEIKIRETSLLLRKNEVSPLLWEII